MRRGSGCPAPRGCRSDQGRGESACGCSLGAPKSCPFSAGGGCRFYVAPHSTRESEGTASVAASTHAVRAGRGKRETGPARAEVTPNTRQTLATPRLIRRHQILTDKWYRVPADSHHPSPPPGALGSPTHVKQHPLAPADKRPRPQPRRARPRGGSCCCGGGRGEQGPRCHPLLPARCVLRDPGGSLARQSLSPAHDQCRV